MGFSKIGITALNYAVKDNILDRLAGLFKELLIAKVFTRYRFNLNTEIGVMLSGWPNGEYQLSWLNGLYLTLGYPTFDNFGLLINDVFQITIQVIFKNRRALNNL